MQSKKCIITQSNKNRGGKKQDAVRENSREGREGLSKDVVFKLKSAKTGRSRSTQAPGDWPRQGTQTAWRGFKKVGEGK